MVDFNLNALKQLYTAKYSPAVIVQGSHDLKGNMVDPLREPFLIPIYQRLYTWEHAHVYRLLHDLWEACQSKPPVEYFIGALVTTRENRPDSTAWELIDGQQRLTTLWVIASVLVTKNVLTENSRLQWQKFLALPDGKPRLHFSGRESDAKSLRKFVSHYRCGCSEAVCKESCSKWLTNENLLIAHKTIVDFLDNVTGASSLQAFSDYIWSKATFVITHLHPDTEKERFFDTMNSRGVQLEKHEILKALLLHSIDGQQQRVAYARAWDLCADIHGFIKGDLQAQLGYGLRQLDENCVVRVLSPNSINGQNEQAEQSAQTDAGLSLEQILASDFSLPEVGDDTGRKNQTHYKSPVSFPVFLLHVLRIFKNDTDEKISLNDKKLIQTFKASFSPTDEQQHRVKPYEDKQQCMEFIECLLRCRLLLDNFVIKGQRVEGSDHANWQIWSRLADKNNKDRRERTGKQWASIMMLQSMMYFSRDVTHAPWLTKTLRSLHELANPPGWDGKDGVRFLEKLQQQDMAYAQSTLKGKSLSDTIGTGKDHKGHGTGTPHYWFYKLEYCLWELWFNQPQSQATLAVKRPDLLAARDIFRMRHVTSVEHVSPQSRNNGVITHLNRFGNLALISDSENSSYSDREPIEKKGIFMARLNKDLIQSLKLAHIFDSMGDNLSDWNDTVMAEHENAMVTVLKAFHPELKYDNNEEVGTGT